MSLWVIRVFFLILCVTGGYAVGELRPDIIAPPFGPVAGFGLGGLLIAVDEMLKGFSLRAFSAATAGLALGTAIAWMVDRSQLFHAASPDAQWILRLCCFLAFG